MTLTSVLTLLVSTIDIASLRETAAAAFESGGSREEVEALVAALLDALVPEELLGVRADEVGAPIYAAASAHVVALVLRQGRKRTGKVPAVVQRELDRVAEAVRQRNGG